MLLYECVKRLVRVGIESCEQYRATKEEDTNIVGDSNSVHARQRDSAARCWVVRASDAPVAESRCITDVVLVSRRFYRFQVPSRCDTM